MATPRSKKVSQTIHTKAYPILMYPSTPTVWKESNLAHYKNQSQRERLPNNYAIMCTAKVEAPLRQEDTYRISRKGLTPIKR